MLPQELPGLGLVLAKRAGNNGRGRGLLVSLFLEPAGADPEVLLEEGRRYHLDLAVRAPPEARLLNSGGGDHGGNARLDGQRRLVRLGRQESGPGGEHRWLKGEA